MKKRSSIKAIAAALGIAATLLPAHLHAQALRATVSNESLINTADYDFSPSYNPHTKDIIFVSTRSAGGKYDMR